MIRKIGCLELPVSSMDKSVAFYEKILGLRKTYEHPVWTAFDVGGVSFALAAAGTKGSKEEAKTCCSCSFCVLRFVTGKEKADKDVPSATSVIYFEVENLEESYSKLKNEGVEFITEPREQGWGGKTAVMLDPDRNLIVLSQV